MSARAVCAVLGLTAAFVLVNAPAQAVPAGAGYPARPIRVIQPAPPGGASDVILRAVAQNLAAAWGQPVVVDNRPGAHGMIGNELAARAKPDGYTLLYGTVGTLAINTGLYTKAPYRMPDDFSPVTQCIDQPNVVIVYAGLPIASLSELVQLAKLKPGQLSFASAGSGSATHLGPEMFRIHAGLDIRHVPYKGAAAAAVAVAGGEVQMLFVSPVTAMPFIKSGKVRPLAVTAAQRVPVLPDVPTLAESGYPGLSYTAWSGLLAPRGTPRPILDKVFAEVVKILGAQDMRDMIGRDGSTAAWSASPEAFAQFIRSETARWGKVIAATGARIE